MNSANIRIKNCFERLRTENKAGLITFITAGDPNKEISQIILEKLPGAGADLIELGMPFTDPMADGPAIQFSSQRALSNGQTTSRTLEMVHKFRQGDIETPVILMGYYNPIYSYGSLQFCKDAAGAGVDGLIVVDLPPEEDPDLREPAHNAGIDFIRLTTPTSNNSRLPELLTHGSGFIYHVSVAGITGAKSANTGSVVNDLERIRKFSSLPIAVGFGIKNPDQAANIASLADAAVVGSAIVEKIANMGNSTESLDEVLKFVEDLSRAVKTAHRLESR